MSLAAFLNQHGYLRIPLSRSGVGHFHTEGSLNGRPVSVLIDTGAASRPTLGPLRFEVKRTAAVINHRRVRFQHVNAEYRLDRRRAFEGQGLIDVRQVHGEQAANPRRNTAERETGTLNLVHLQLGRPRAAAEHR